jgi:hypothetical protein
MPGVSVRAPGPGSSRSGAPVASKKLNCPVPLSTRARTLLVAMVTSVLVSLRVKNTVGRGWITARLFAGAGVCVA